MALHIICSNHTSLVIDCAASDLRSGSCERRARRYPRACWRGRATTPLQPTIRIESRRDVREAITHSHFSFGSPCVRDRTLCVNTERLDSALRRLKGPCMLCSLCSYVRERRGGTMVETAVAGLGSGAGDSSGAGAGAGAGAGRTTGAAADTGRKRKACISPRKAQADRGYGGRKGVRLQSLHTACSSSNDGFSYQSVRTNGLEIRAGPTYYQCACWGSCCCRRSVALAGERAARRGQLHVQKKQGSNVEIIIPMLQGTLLMRRHVLLQSYALTAACRAGRGGEGYGGLLHGLAHVQCAAEGGSQATRRRLTHRHRHISGGVGGGSVAVGLHGCQVADHLLGGELHVLRHTCTERQVEHTHRDKVKRLWTGA